MKILVVDDDDAIREVLVLLFENFFNEVDIVECVSGNQAKKLVSSDPYFQLIVSDFDMPDGDGGQFYNFLKGEGYDIPFLLYTSKSLSELSFSESFPNESQSEFFIQKGNPIEKFREMLLQIPAISSKLSESQENSLYKKVRVFYFFRYSKTLVDIYLKLNENKYVKIINKGDRLDFGTIDKYAQKQLNYLHIKNDDYNSFATSLATHPFLEFDKDMPMEQRFTQTNAIVQNMARSTGISKSVIKMAERNIDLLLDEVESVKTLGPMLNKMRSRLDYSYDHSYLLSYFCSMLCDKMGWNTRRSREKLCLAALFHDITLTNPDIAMIQNKDSDQFAMLSEAEKSHYLSHPEKAADLVKELSIDYPGVEDIIYQHHERPDRTGFPKGISFSQIKPLNCLFIVVHEFITGMYEVEFEPSEYEGILEEMETKYNKGHFVKIIEKFKTIFDIGKLRKDILK